jgi:hypothetical protein
MHIFAIAYIYLIKHQMLFQISGLSDLIVVGPIYEVGRLRLVTFMLGDMTDLSGAGHHIYIFI